MTSAKEFWSNSVRSRLSPLQCSPSTSNTLDICNARGRIQEEMDAMSIAFSDAAAAFNDLVPISRLPNEIISTIFTELLLIDAPVAYQDGYELGWIKVTHVCRLWRRVAINHPSLWTTISSEAGFHWMVEMLERSQSCLIDINITDCPHGRSASDLVDILTEQISRTKNINLHAPLQVVVQLIPLLNAYAPALEGVGVAAPAMDAWSDLNFDDIILPPGLFANGAPSLSRVSLLSCINFPWSTVVATNLTHIRLDNRAGDAGRMTPQVYISFITALTQASRLNVMNLNHILPWPNSENGVSPSGSTRGAHLPTLTELNIMDFPMPVVPFMDHVRIAKSTRFFLDCIHRPHGGGFRALVPLLRPFIGTPFKPLSAYIEAKVPASTLRVSRGPLTVTIRTWNTVVDFPSNVGNQLCPAADLELVFFWGDATTMDEPRVGDFCRDLCVALQLHGLRSLTVKVDALEQFVAFDWIESFGPARDVDRLFLSMNAADSFCAALATAVPPGPNVPQPQNPAVLFPSFEFLSFRDTWFGAQRDSDTATRLIHESLTLTLKARAAVGRVPKFVAMNWCDMRPWVEEWVEGAGSEAAREWKTVEWTEPGPDPGSQSQSEEESVADSDAE